MVIPCTGNAPLVLVGDWAGCCKISLVLDAGRNPVTEERNGSAMAPVFLFLLVISPLLLGR
jgi:hypothetical protein